VQPLPAQLVTTPQTVHSFTRKIVGGVGDAVYSPAVLRLRGQSQPSDRRVLAVLAHLEDDPPGS